jgi:AcrR family transcriptional regulator
MTSSSDNKGGLRERKKAKTKSAIQSHAIRLFREQGFAATTVEQVAEAAEVSPSTVFRYFATKEDLVVNDDYDPIVFAAFEAQPPELNLIQAWRHAMRDGIEQMTPQDMETQLNRSRLLLSVPELWGATLDSTQETLGIMMRLSAERVGRSPDDPEVRATVGAIVGVMLSAALEWVKTEDPRILATIDDALERLDKGLLR